FESRGCISTQTLQPLIWLARRWTSSNVFFGTPDCSVALPSIYSACLARCGGSLQEQEFRFRLRSWQVNAGGERDVSNEESDEGACLWRSASPGAAPSRAADTEWPRPSWRPDRFPTCAAIQKVRILIEGRKLPPP